MKKIIFFAIAILMMASCAHTPTLAEQFTALADKVEQNGDKFSADQWKEAGSQFDALVEQYNNDIETLTPDDKKTIGNAIGRFQAARIKAGLNEFGNAVDNALESAKGFVDGLSHSTNE